MKIASEQWLIASWEVPAVVWETKAKHIKEFIANTTRLCGVKILEQSSVSQANTLATGSRLSTYQLLGKPKDFYRFQDNLGYYLSALNAQELVV